MDYRLLAAIEELSESMCQALIVARLHSELNGAVPFALAENLRTGAGLIEQAAGRAQNISNELRTQGASTTLFDEIVIDLMNLKKTVILELEKYQLDVNTEEACASVEAADSISELNRMFNL